MASYSESHVGWSYIQISGGKIVRTYKLVAVGFSMLVALGPASVHAQTIFEVENARANARAGGPTSQNQADILKRWGCESGTKSPACNHNRGSTKNRAHRAKDRRRR